MVPVGEWTRPASTPRMYGILATKAPIALIFRRGPSRWFHLLRWRLDTGILEPGVWVAKKLFPRRCDLSADGELLLYYIAGGFEGGYRVLGGISRTPWLRPLAKWDEHATWGRGSCFVTDGIDHVWDTPRVVQSAGGPMTIQRNNNISFVNERRRGWSEAPDCPPRDPSDVWDEHRSVVLHKACDSNGCTLRLISDRSACQGAIEGRAPRFELDLPSGDRIAIRDAAWAEWDHAGRLLVATTAGHLTIREPSAAMPWIESHDLSSLTPNPAPPPDWATAAPPRRS